MKDTWERRICEGNDFWWLTIQKCIRINYFGDLFLMIGSVDIESASIYYSRLFATVQNSVTEHVKDEWDQMRLIKKPFLHFSLWIAQKTLKNRQCVECSRIAIWTCCRLQTKCISCHHFSFGHVDTGISLLLMLSGSPRHIVDTGVWK